MRIRSVVLMAVAALAWAMAAPPDAAARRCKDDAACRACFDATLASACGNGLDLIFAREGRNEALTVRYQVCAAQAPGRPGSCRLTFKVLNQCRRTREFASERSWATFKRQARRECGRRAVTAAGKARRQCFRDASCPCAAPPIPTTTTTTTTTTSTTTISTTTTTTTSTTMTGMTTTTAASGTMTSAASSPTRTTRSTNGGAVPAALERSACQQQCIRRVARSCYDDCGASCHGDHEALPKCLRACRNGQCADLRALCVPGEDTDFDSNNPQGLNPDYFACCKINDVCDLDDEETLSCETTTTVTTTTTTSSTSTTTGTGPTTTTIVGTTTTTLF